MDQDQSRKIFAFIVCVILVIIYKQTVLDPFLGHPTIATNPTSQAESAKVQEPENSAARFETVDSTATPTASGAIVDSTKGRAIGYPSDKQLEEAGTFIIETDVVKAEVTYLGGRIRSLSLKGYKETDEKNSELYNLVNHFEHSPLPGGVYVGHESDAWVKYELVSGVPGRLQSGGEETLVLKGTLPDGRDIEKVLTFDASTHLLKIKALTRADDLGDRMELEWSRFLAAESPSMLDRYNVSEIAWFDPELNKAFHEPLHSLKEEEKDLGAVRWVSLGNTYFMAAFLSPDRLSQARAFNTNQLYRIRISGSDTSVESELFVGPKKLSLLKSVGSELTRSINYGWTAFISVPLTAILHFFYGLFHNYGLAIIALTLLVKAVLYPINNAAFQQMKKMQDISPEIKRIQENIKDKQQQQMEMIALYKKRGVNPAGGCLPMFAQIPIFFGLYSALVVAVELRHAPFALWIHDLSAPERLHVFGIGIPVLVIIYVVSMLLQQWMTPATMDPTQKKIMMVMPLVFGSMFIKFPGGLTLYFLTNNFMSIAQQQALKRTNAGRAMRITAVAGIAIFSFAYLLTLMS